MKLDWDDLLKEIPAHMHGGLKAYVEHGRRPGGFLTALLSGDMRGAWVNADPANRNAETEWRQVVRKLPVDSHGSTEVFEAWIKHGGFDGQQPSNEEFAEQMTGLACSHNLMADTLKNEIVVQKDDVIKLPRRIVEMIVAMHTDTAKTLIDLAGVASAESS